MIQDILSSKTNKDLLLKSLDASMLRERVLANNIANVSTPGYKRVDVAFEEELRKALDTTRVKGSTTNERHLELGRKEIRDVEAKAYSPVDTSLPSGINNVDIDMEMAKLSENQLTYSMGLKFLRGMYQKLNAAVMGKSVTS